MSLRLELSVYVAEEYFEHQGKEIDWDENDPTKVPLEQAELVSRILAMEVSIFLMRRAYNVCGSFIDTVAEMRREIKNDYEVRFEKYIEHNDYY